MNKTLRIMLAQCNMAVGDIAGNLQQHMTAVNKAQRENVDILLFPELSLTGYPVEDLLLRSYFVADADAALQSLAATVNHLYCFVGHPSLQQGTVTNTCSILHDGRIEAVYAKQKLPNYGVFDEERYFQAGNQSCVVNIKGIKIGVLICEDIWHTEPVLHAVQQGAELVVIINASPFEIDKHEKRVAMLTKQAKDNHVALVYVNHIGAQDEIIYDGDSMVLNAQGEINFLAPTFVVAEPVLDIALNEKNIITHSSLPSVAPLQPEEKIYRALMLGLTDYIEKNHFPGVLIGLSGGIDSALTMAIAVDALGKERVHGVLMPSRYTEKRSIEDALLLANSLGVATEIISIEPSYTAFLTSLAPSFAGTEPNIAEENLQARCRASLLMALSNKYGHLVLTTGNRSELAVGYCTLYGDMAGGYSVLKDVPKTLVYTLSEYRNTLSPVIPAQVINRPPTAELALNQKDEDSLPPYPILDRILECYLMKSESAEEIIAQGFEREVVMKVVKLIRRNEYKRKQAAIGARINNMSFGKDWRYPVTNGFKG